MMMIPSNDKRDGHNFGPPSWNSAAFVYITFISLYTFVISCGIYVLWCNRHSAPVRMRGATITTAAVLSLHVYVAALFIVYPLNGYFTCGSEFWIMSTLLPLGIAMFQASNMRFLYFSKLQGELIRYPRWIQRKVPFSLQPRELMAWYRNLDYVKKTYCCISLGLMIQVATTLFLYFGSKRFMPSTGFFGQISNPAECRQGFEWIPSVVWQLVWSWIFGPYVYFKTRHVRDVHYWGWQTRLSILAGLPGTPLWLGFLYGTKNHTVAALDPWFLPALWFAPGLITMQLTSVFVPIYDFRTTRVAKTAKRTSSVLSIPWSTSTLAFWKRTNGSEINKELLSISAMEFQLSHNVKPLMNFAGTREFSAENIIFLYEIHKFRLSWSRSTHDRYETINSSFQDWHRRMFRRASDIFFELIEPKTARQPINLEYHILSKLRQLFQEARNKDGTHHQQIVNQEREPASLTDIAPWVILNPMTAALPEPVCMEQTLGVDSNGANHLATGIQDASKTGTGNTVHGDSISHITETWPETRNSSVTLLQDAPENFQGGLTAVPDNFTMNVFDEAERSVKQLVYTNTWAKFIECADADSIAYSRTSESNSDDRSNPHGMDERVDEALVGHRPSAGSRCKTCAEWQRQNEHKRLNCN